MHMSINQSKLIFRVTMWSPSHELSSGENRTSLWCTVPEIFGSEHNEQKCEQCEQRASRQRARASLLASSELGSHAIGLDNDQSRTSFVSTVP